jgi:hypothetical protein
MKKMLLVFLSLLCQILVVQAEGNLKSKGVEIDGDLSSFAKKLEGQGFTISSVEDDYYKMTGTFTAQDVKLVVRATPYSKIVYSVLVVYKPIHPWPSQEQHYKKIVENLKNKYGTPSEEIWDVNTSMPEHYISEKKSTAQTRFNCENGEITIGIYNTLYVGVSTYILYQDKENYAIYEEEVASDL